MTDGVGARAELVKLAPEFGAALRSSPRFRSAPSCGPPWDGAQMNGVLSELRVTLPHRPVQRRGGLLEVDVRAGLAAGVADAHLEVTGN